MPCLQIHSPLPSTQSPTRFRGLRSGTERRPIPRTTSRSPSVSRTPRPLEVARAGMCGWTSRSWRRTHSFRVPLGWFHPATSSRSTNRPMVRSRTLTFCSTQRVSSVGSRTPT
nr:MAG: hypothetical protein 2 [Leviviridae sp.]